MRSQKGLDMISGEEYPESQVGFFIPFVFAAFRLPEQRPNR
jgi:hypothetical protein